MIPQKGEARITLEVIVPVSELHKVQAGTRPGYRDLVAEALEKSGIEPPYSHEIIEVMKGKE